MSVQETENIWQRHFDEIMNVQNQYATDDLPETRGPCLEFSLKEVKDALDSISSFKAAGPIGVTASMLKVVGGQAMRVLRSMANDILRCGTLLEDLKQNLIIPLFKGNRDPFFPNSFRGIKLPFNLSKCWRN